MRHQETGVTTAQGPKLLDVRTLQPRNRHQTILERLGAIDAGETPVPMAIAATTNAATTATTTIRGDGSGSLIEGSARSICPNRDRLVRADRADQHPSGSTGEAPRRTARTLRNVIRPGLVRGTGKLYRNTICHPHRSLTTTISSCSGCARG